MDPEEKKQILTPGDENKDTSLFKQIFSNMAQGEIAWIQISPQHYDGTAFG